MWNRFHRGALFVLLAAGFILWGPQRLFQRTPSEESSDVPFPHETERHDHEQTPEGGGPMSQETTTQGKVYHADRSNFQQRVLDADVPVLVDFYADWCGPCRMVAPVLEQLAAETPETEARIVKVNVDESPELAQRYGVSSIPNLKVFRDGQVVNEHLGFAGKDYLKSMLGQ